MPLTIGGQTLGAALPWADPSVMSPTDMAMGVATPATGQLKSSVLARTAFFHHRTGTTVHGDQPKVMKLLGDMSGGEMAVSAFAKHLSTCFGTVQAAPISVGARGNSSELVSFAGRTLPSISPTQLKQLLTGSKTDPLVKARVLRDQALNQLNQMAKDDGSNLQKQFLDKLVDQPDAGARAGRPARHDAGRDHGRRRQRPGAGGGGADLRERHARRHGSPQLRRRQPHRHEPAGRGRPARQRREGHPDGDERARHADGRGAASASPNASRSRR